MFAIDFVCDSTLRQAKSGNNAASERETVGVREFGRVAKILVHFTQRIILDSSLMLIVIFIPKFAAGRVALMLILIFSARLRPFDCVSDSFRSSDPTRVSWQG